MKIYTKSGDKGKTSLVNGRRVFKYNSRIDLYGDVDELNSSVGLLAFYLEELIYRINDSLLKKNRELISLLQHELFVLGSLLACESKDHTKFALNDVSGDLITKIELTIDQMEEVLPPLKNFILPSGCLSALYAHQARCLTRRVERKLCSFGKKYPKEVSSEALMLINRLSDYFFVLSRYCNYCSKNSEEIWINKKAT